MSQEKQLQKDYGSVKRAEKFYNNQQIDHLNDMMIQFISNQEIMFIATSDNEGNCDNSIRAGKKASFLSSTKKHYYTPNTEVMESMPV